MLLLLLPGLLWLLAAAPLSLSGQLVGLLAACCRKPHGPKVQVQVEQQEGEQGGREGGAGNVGRVAAIVHIGRLVSGL